MDSRRTAYVPVQGHSIAQPIKPLGWWTTTLLWLDEWSVWESAGLIGSAIVLVVMAYILHTHNLKEVPTWQRVSLNTVVSWLSTIARLLLSIPLSSGVGQLKWVWMAKKRRNMVDLRKFDAASRGVLGSLGLLLDIGAKHLASLSAVAMVLIVGVEPSNQFVIEYYQENIRDTSRVAYLANATSYNSYGPIPAGAEGFLPPIDPILKANVYNSIYNPNSYETWGLPEFVCESGNCTWDPIASLEVRSLCSDITPFLQRNCSVLTTYEALSQQFTPLVYANVSYGSDPNTEHRNPTITGTGKITNKTQWVATECALEVFVRSSQASVQDSTYQETTLASWSDTVTAPWNTSFDAMYVGFTVPENISLGVHKTDRFILGRGAKASMYFGLLEWFNGTVIGSYGTPFTFDPVYGSSVGTTSGDIMGALMLQQYANCARPEDKFKCFMSNIASAMSKTFRDSAFNNAKYTNASGADNNAHSKARMAVGQTLVPATFVRIRWQWMSLSVFVWILSAITWFWTITFTRRAKLHKWRNDIIPLLFLYRPESVDVKDEQGVSSQSFAIRAQDTQVVLSIENNKAKLS
ncbi:hypothetical protein GGR58DRAFT_509944 [Xylaria digitata]|nr:hypothetical protein GGR58DRAFT_509944 [Xylaria digitata]